MKSFSTPQLKIAFLVAATLLVSLSVYSYVRISNLMKISSWINHTAAVKIELEQFYAQMRGMESAMRGYLLTSDTLYITEFGTAKRQSEQDLAAIKNNIEDNYSQRKNLAVLEKLVASRMANMDTILSVGSLKGLSAAQRLSFRKNRQDLSFQISKMRNEEDMLLRIRKRSLIKERTLTPLLAGTLTFGSIFVLLLSYYAIFRQLKIATELREDLENKNASLEKMNKELESFTYISSHDLQEPLRKIQTFVSILLDKESAGFSDTGRHYMQRVQISANRMQNLIRDLLAYSRLKVEVFPVQQHDLSHLISEIREDFEELGALEITLQGQTHAPIIVSQFRQLLANLVSNSIKFAQEGQPAFVSINNERVTSDEMPKMFQTTQSNYLKITVSDRGIGFDPQYRERIFKVFQRLHIDQQYQGTGIGLAIVKKIVDNHKGFITADSVPGQGATFTIYLPA